MWAIEPSLLIEIVPGQHKYRYYCLDFGLAAVQSLGDGAEYDGSRCFHVFPRQHLKSNIQDMIIQKKIF